MDGERQAHVGPAALSACASTPQWVASSVRPIGRWKSEEGPCFAIGTDEDQTMPELQGQGKVAILVAM